ncbi:MAG: hypothetical protein K0Q95_434 [Bacteroidota bacterium]|nr:hypothetical protein [Bacteroidota bacterium]
MDELNTEESIRAKLVSVFDSPFPKRNRNLSRILGDTLEIKGTCSPKSYWIVSKRKSNFIIDLDGNDTLFKGTVCKYRDLYYFSEKINKSDFRIFAIKANDSLIYGLQNYFQYASVDSTIATGKYPKLVKLNDKSSKRIILHPDKRELRKLFTSIMNKTKPFEIIRNSSQPASPEIEDAIEPVEADDYDLISKVYPNPASNEVNVDLQQRTNSSFQLTDFSGKIILQGSLNEISNKIDISKQRTGIYALTVISANQLKETVKIVKAE